MIPETLRVVDSAEIDTYPIPVGVRLVSHGWFAFYHTWWRASEFRRDADRDVRAVFIDLLCAAQDEDPVGTLPVEPRALAWAARISLEEWQLLAARPISPLHGWRRCLVSDGRQRLYHPKLLEVTESAARAHIDAVNRRASDRERKRLKDLPDKVVMAGGSQRMAQDSGYIARLDQHLTETLPVGMTRTVARVRAAMEDLAMQG